MLEALATLSDLPVALYVYETSQVEISADENVRLEQLVYTAPTGFDLETRGALLPPGSNGLTLGPGVYYFRLEGSGTLEVDSSTVVVITATRPKVPWPAMPPPPPPFSATQPFWSDHQDALQSRGEPIDGQQPELRVIDRRRA